MRSGQLAGQAEYRPGRGCFRKCRLRSPQTGLWLSRKPLRDHRRTITVDNHGPPTHTRSMQPQQTPAEIRLRGGNRGYARAT